MTRIDTRLTTTGLVLTVPQLIAIWADHCPAHLPVPLTCPGCGHTYTTVEPLCPTAAVVRPLVQRRRYQVPVQAFQVLTFNQQRDLLDKHLSTATAALVRPAPPPPVTVEQPGLFDPIRTPGKGARP